MAEVRRGMGEFHAAEGALRERPEIGVGYYEGRLRFGSDAADLLREARDSGEALTYHGPAADVDHPVWTSVVVLEVEADGPDVHATVAARGGLERT